MRWVFKQGEKPKPLRVSNPCIGYCSATSLGDAVCLGCYRDFEDVRDWNGYTEHQKVIAMMKAHQNFKEAERKKANGLS